MKNPKCRAIILNYNGRELLEKFLPSVLDSARHSRYGCAVSVLDNCSSDSSIDFLTQNFPDVHIFKASANKVLCSYNEMLRTIDDDIVILLNSDIQTEENFFDPLIETLLSHEDAFMASSHEDRAIPRIKWGIWSAGIDYPEYPSLLEKPGYVFSAGIGAFHRQRFLLLGGYDEMYLPGYYEDVDLCYRAWKRGWKGYYQPLSRKWHQGSASFKKEYGNYRIQRLAYRNSLLFMIKNMKDPCYFALFLMMILPRLAAAFVTGKTFILQGFIDAFSHLPRALRSRRNPTSENRITDRGLLNLFRGNTENT